MAAETGHRRRSLVEIGVDEVAPVLGVELRGEARRADEVAEHDRDRTALGRDLGSFVGGAGEGCSRSARKSRRRQGGDRGEQHAPIAYGRNADLLEVLGRQVREDRLLDPVIAKRGLVLAKAETAKPPADIHGRAPHGLAGYSSSRRELSSGTVGAQPTEERKDRLVLQSANEAVDVAEYKKVAYPGALEGEDRHAGPPHVAAARRHSKQFLANKIVEPHLAADAISAIMPRNLEAQSQ